MSSKDVHASPITPAFPYMLHLVQSGKFQMSVIKLEGESASSSILWLKTKVVPKVIRWCLCENQTASKPSLGLVPIKAFSETYANLKAKYGKKIVENWPESTDPLKFVYEDIGIAAYLMTIWSEERKLQNSEQKQSFVDLGCGNGLLVHILASEGHCGIGIDVRKREIWSSYGPETVLMEQTIIPSDSNLFPDYDWIIGNHSDELTPWIPVIAARSSYKMRVFLLPCCCYTFNGKFGRPNAAHTMYQSYLDFVEELCKVMGFNVCRDKLRIPSTKRVCFVCPSRNYDVALEENVDSRRTAYIVQHSNDDCIQHIKVPVQNIVTSCDTINVDGPKSEAWAESFKPKAKTEPVRNCSALDATFIASTIKIVADMLLQKEAFVELDSKEGKILWNQGGTWHLKDIANALGSEILQKLKSQCGGLQTLFRSHRNIFTEHGGHISLTIPSAATPIVKRRKKMKNNDLEKKRLLLKFATKPCFFYFHHPQGCPLADECKFSHDSK